MVRDGSSGCMATLEGKLTHGLWASENDVDLPQVIVSFEYGELLGNRWVAREDRRSGNVDLLSALNAGLREVMSEGAHVELADKYGISAPSSPNVKVQQRSD